jgi:hypothetical protein
MTDEQRQDEAPIIVPGGGVHNDHWCEYPGCKAWGSFGYRSRRRRAGTAARIARSDLSASCVAAQYRPR